MSPPVVVKQKAADLYKDPIELLLRRIMYAEGDADLHLQNTEAVALLKEKLPEIVSLLFLNTNIEPLAPAEKAECKSQNEACTSLDTGLLRYTFQTQLRRFYKTKSLTEGLDDQAADQKTAGPLDDDDDDLDP